MQWLLCSFYPEMLVEWNACWSIANCHSFSYCSCIGIALGLLFLQTSCFLDEIKLFDNIRLSCWIILLVFNDLNQFLSFFLAYSFLKHGSSVWCITCPSNISIHLSHISVFHDFFSDICHCQLLRSVKYTKKYWVDQSKVDKFYKFCRLVCLT